MFKISFKKIKVLNDPVCEMVHKPIVKFLHKMSMMIFHLNSDQKIWAVMSNGNGKTENVNKIITGTWMSKHLSDSTELAFIRKVWGWTSFHISTIFCSSLFNLMDIKYYGGVLVCRKVLPWLTIFLQFLISQVFVPGTAASVSFVTFTPSFLANALISSRLTSILSPNNPHIASRASQLLNEWQHIPHTQIL